MRGTLTQRYKGSWSLIIDLGYQLDPATGTTKRRQKWITFRGTKRDAETKLNELMRDQNRGEFVEPSKQTFGGWLAEWLEKSVKPPVLRPRTYGTYKSVVDTHLLTSPLVGLRLQALKSLDIERYYAEKTLAPATLLLHQAIIHSALKAAQRQGLVSRNVSEMVNGKPKAGNPSEHAREHCWEADEARRFLATVTQQDNPQTAAFYALALDSGARKAELCGLQWSALNLDAAKVSIHQQLAAVVDSAPTFGPPKNGQARTIDLAAETVRLLLAHRRHQAEMKMANRATYHDTGLIFAKEWAERARKRDQLGDPWSLSHVGQAHFKRLVAAAKVRPIKFHGLRHTCATLLFQAGVPARVIQERLGHKKIEITLAVYGHVLPSMQQDAAAKLGAILHG